MEQSSLKYVVIAIVAFVLLFLFLQYFAPLYLWADDPTEAVENQLEAAETQLGQFTSEDTYFPAGHVVQAMAYEAADRSIVFNCNSDLHCCDEGEDCDKAIEWDNSGEKRYFSFGTQKPVAVSARCRHQDLYICKVFIGEEPAQVEIKELELETRELDLAESESIKASFEAENTGAQDMIAVQAIARLYKLKAKPEAGMERERELVGEFTEEFELKQGEKHQGEIDVEITENGNFEVEVILQEKTDETNYEMQSFDVTAFGKVETGGCVAGEMTVQELEKCVYLLPCECKSIVECEAMWRSLLEIPIEEELELMSADEEKEEIVLKYSAEYNIPEWCDPETMECEGYCIEQPEPECRISPCIEDAANCRVWLPCNCDFGASFQLCKDLWTEKLGRSDFKTGTRSGKSMLYVQGANVRVPHEICDHCGNVIRSWIDCCELPAIENCGGNKCQGTTVQQPPPEAPVEVPKDCEPEMLDCFSIPDPVCNTIFPCECASYPQCKALWTAKLRSEGFTGVLDFTEYNYQIDGKNTSVPAIEGREVCDDPWCEEKWGNCTYGILMPGRCGQPST